VCVVEVVELMTSRAPDKSESATELQTALRLLTTQTVCYVSSVSLCTAAQTSGVNAKFWRSLEQRALDVLEKVFPLFHTGRMSQMTLMLLLR